MDKQFLVKTLDKLFGALKQRGVEVTDHRVMPAYYGFRELPLRVGIVVPAWQNKDSLLEKVETIVSVLHSGIFKPEERAYVLTVLPFGSLQEMNEDFDEREGVGRPVVEPYWPD